LEEPDTPLSHVRDEQVEFGWFILKQLRENTLRNQSQNHPNALRYLTQAALDLNGFSKMTVSLAQGICNRDVCCLLLASNDALNAELQSLRPPPPNRANDADKVAEYHADIYRLTRLLYCQRATLMYLHAMHLMYVVFAMSKYPIR
jgi:hypothetical protein